MDITKYKSTLLIIIALFFSNFISIAQSQPLAEKGVLDLREWHFYENGLVDLDGEWEFYWKQLLTPADFKDDSLTSGKQYFNVPSLWNNKLLKTEFDQVEKINSFGYGTFRLKVQVPKQFRVFSIKIGRAHV